MKKTLTKKKKDNFKKHLLNNTHKFKIKNILKVSGDNNKKIRVFLPNTQKVNKKIQMIQSI